MVAQKQWGKMVSVQGTEIKYVPLEEALDYLKSVPQERWEEAAVLFGTAKPRRFSKLAEHSY